MKTPNVGRALAAWLILAMAGAPGAVRSDDDDAAGHRAHELAEKMARASKKAEEWPRKSIKRGEKRRKEEAEELSEVQEEARERAEKGARQASKLAAKARIDRASARLAILEGNPPVEIDRDDRLAIRVAVNASYPEAAPVSTVPPSVLLSLPQIPAEYVEYRFVNRDLLSRSKASTTSWWGRAARCARATSRART